MKMNFINETKHSQNSESTDLSIFTRYFFDIFFFRYKNFVTMFIKLLATTPFAAPADEINDQEVALASVFSIIP